MNADLLGPLMFVVVFLLIFLGYPVAFSLGGAALIFAVIGVDAGYFGWDYMALFPERVFGVMSNQVLLAVPFFIFMGTMLERSRLAEDLLRTIGLLFGPVRGGLALLFALYLLVLARLRPELAPALPPEEREAVKDLKRQVLLVLIPPLFLILVVLGSIFAGVATPTEAGALGAVGAMVLAKMHGRLNRETHGGTMHETLRLTCMVVFLLVGSTAFALVFRGLNGDVWIEELLTNLPGGLIGFLIVANLSVFLLGFFIDFFEIAFILLPLLAPAARVLCGEYFPDAVGDEYMIWFGVMIAMNLQTSFLTPPFGFSLFYLRGVTPREIPTTAIYKGAVPFIAIQLVALAVVAAFPAVVTYLL